MIAPTARNTVNKIFVFGCQGGEVAGVPMVVVSGCSFFYLTFVKRSAIIGFYGTMISYTTKRVTHE